jgi:hypothetical protein
MQSFFDTGILSGALMKAERQALDSYLNAACFKG